MGRGRGSVLVRLSVISGVRGAERAGDRQEPGAAVEGDSSMDQV